MFPLQHRLDLGRGKKRKKPKSASCKGFIKSVMFKKEKGADFVYLPGSADKTVRHFLHFQTSLLFFCFFCFFVLLKRWEVWLERHKINISLSPFSPFDFSPKKT